MERIMLPTLLLSIPILYVQESEQHVKRLSPLKKWQNKRAMMAQDHSLELRLAMKVMASME